MDLTFSYSDLTRHVEREIAVLMDSAKTAGSRRERQTFEDKASGVLRLYDGLTYRAVQSLGDAVLAEHCETYARLLDIVGEHERANQARRYGSA
jgi:hypothetical protein